MMRAVIRALVVLVFAVATVWWWRSARLASPAPTGPVATSSSVGAAQAARPSGAPAAPSAATPAPALAPEWGAPGLNLPAGPLRAGLLALSPEIGVRAVERLRAMRVPVQDVSELRVSPGGEFYYVCAAPGHHHHHGEESREMGDAATARPADDDQVAEPAVAATAAPGAPLAAPVPVAQPPIRHSRPGATRVAYLDFNGHTVTGTSWNVTYGVTSFVAKAYDTDGDPTTFSDAEQAAIIRIWERIAEDFAPFDIDITTEEPASFTATTARVLITAHVDANGQTNPEGAGAGGVAYVGVFGNATFPTLYSPAWVYHTRLGNEANTAEAASHELGHNLGLVHDGTTSLAYYGGHGSGETSWGPIMGTGYNRNVSQWSKGEYLNANNAQDDLVVLSSRLTYRADDVGDTNATAAALTVTNSATVSGAGLIERTGDADRFTFTTGAGSVQLTAAPYRAATLTYGGNLDVKLELYDATGAIVAVADPAAATTATVNVDLTAGVYFLRVSGGAAGTPTATPPSGYTNYGSLGAYSISGTIVPPNSLPPVITTQPVDVDTVAGNTVALTATASGAAPLSYAWRRVGSATVLGTDATLSFPNVTVGAAGDYQLTVTNSAGSTASRVVRLSVAPAAVAPVITSSPVSLVRVRGASAEFSVTATGTATLSYLWRRNGVALAGATARTLTLASVTTDDAGNYSVVVTNSAGSATSAPASLVVLTPPEFTTQPGSAAVLPGGSTTFTAVAAGNPAPTLRWQRSTDAGATWTDLSDTTGVSGAATGALTLSGLSAGANGYLYRCVATSSVGTAVSNVAALTVANTPAVIAITSGLSTTLLLRADGSVWATGTNAGAQFGDASTLTRTQPVKIFDGAVGIAAGDVHCLVLKADGTLWAAGDNSQGQLGDGTQLTRIRFVQVATDVAAAYASGYNSAFIKRDGTLWLMGVNRAGEVGGPGASFRATPVQVAEQVRDFSFGSTHFAYVTTAGELWTAGNNTYGQLGNGTTVTSAVPVRVATEVEQVSASYIATLFVKRDGSLWAMGQNTNGLFGDGTTTSRLSPTQVGTGFARVSAQGFHTLRVAADGTLTAAGANNFGQLGGGNTLFGAGVTTLSSSRPLALRAALEWSHWVGADGALWAVGRNFYGQLGDGSTTDRLTPVKVWPGVLSTPAAPAAVRASDGAASDRVRVTWTHVVGALSYEVWRHTSDVFASATRIAAAERVNFFEDRTAQLGTTYYYWVRAIGSGGPSAASTSDSGYVVAAEALPVFLTQPAPVTKLIGETAQFAVAVAGGAVTYQWQLSVNGGAGWSNLAASSTYLTPQSDTLTVARLSGTESGWLFRCVATNANGATASNAAQLTVDLTPRAPLILAPPAPLTITAGQTATFTVDAVGTGTLTYQWRRNGTAISGATSATYTKSNVALADGGTFDVVVTNATGSTTSAAAALVVNEAQLVTPTRLTLSALQQQAVLRINTSGAWQVATTNPATWAIFFTSSGTGSGFAQLLVLQNNTGAPRSFVTQINGENVEVTQLPADGLDNWVWRAPATTGGELMDVTWVGDQFVASGWYGTILTSPDGVNWTLRARDTTFGPSGGRKVATNGSRLVMAVNGSGRIYTSDDRGVTWTVRTVGTGAHMGIACNGSVFVMVDSNGAAWTSPDGLTWTARSTGTTQDLRSVIWADGRFMAGGANGTLLSSPDGVTWTAQNSGMSTMILSLAYANGRWVAGGLSTQCAFSTDGVTWQLGSGGMSNALDIDWDGTRFLAVSSFGNTYTSTDGAVWTKRTIEWQQPVNGVAYGAGKWVAAGRGGMIINSTDGAAWTVVSGPTAQTLRAAIWTGTHYYTVGDYGTLLVSGDGFNWQKLDVGTTEFLSDIVWNGTQFVAIGNAGLVVTSADGVTWNQQPRLTTRKLWGVSWNGSQYLIVGDGGLSFTSPDAVNWTARSMPVSTRANDVLWDGRQYVAVGSDISTSPDGVTWTLRTNPNTGLGMYNSIAWNGSLYVAAGDNSVLATSPDAVTWTKVSLGLSNSLGAVRWNGNRFVMIGSSGLMWTSSDGETWVFRDTKLNADGLTALVQRGDQWLAVGNYGAIVSTADLDQRVAPSIELHPQSRTSVARRAVQFSVVATGLPAPTYQWRRGGVVIPQATNSTLVVTADAATTGDYDVVVTNIAGSVTSRAASLAVIDGFGAWQGESFSADELANATVSGSAADPDGDGLSNLFEYALGLDPRAAAPAPTAVETTNSDWTFTYTRPVGRTDVSYQVEFSTTLGSWTASGVTHELISTTNGVETWRGSVPLATGTAVFFRLRIERP